MRYLLLIVFLFMGIGCPDGHNDNPDSTIYIENNSDFDILFEFVSYRYPDTTVLTDNPFKDDRQYELSVLLANSLVSLPARWIDSFEKDTTPMMVFFFSKDTVDLVSWNKIRDEYKVLKRFDLTKAKLDSLNWTLTYP